MYNLIEYSDNYQDSSATLYQFKRDEPPNNNGNVNEADSSSFKYKASLLGNTVAMPAADGVPAGRKIENAKIVVPLK